MRNSVRFLLLVAAFALAAWLGWWTVPAVAALWGLLRPAVPRPILNAATAALLAWVFWLLVDLRADSGAFLRLGGRLGAVFPLPLPGLLLLTLLFAALLAWSAAALGCGLGNLLFSRHGDTR